MKSRFGSPVLALAVLLGPMMAGPAWSQDERPEYVPNELLIKFKGDVAEHQIQSLLTTVESQTVEQFELVPVYKVSLPDGTLLQAQTFLSDQPMVEYVERNYYRYIDVAPNDPDYPSMWGLDNIGQTGGTPDADIDAPEAWDLTTGDATLVVAVIDSGIDLAHEDLAANLWTNPGEIPGNGFDDDGNGYVDDVNGWDFSRNDNDPSDTETACVGHGTHTAGTIGAVGGNSVGITGINWDIQIMPLKAAKNVLAIFCSLTDADILEAIQYAANNGAMLSNNSYGGSAPNQAIEDAIRASRRLFVVAAGNESNNNDANPSFPASYPLDNIVSVAATDHNDNMASFSNFGLTSVDLGAPGASILSTLPGDAYAAYDGTSMASPHVVGAAALLLAADPTLTPNELKWRLMQSTDFVGIPTVTGGRLNTFGALALPPPEVTIDVTPLGPTTVSAGQTIDYRVTVNNTSAASQTVAASVVAVTPDGNELTLKNQMVSLAAGASVSADFSFRVRLSVPAGAYHLVGRVENSGLDEDVVVYDIIR